MLLPSEILCVSSYLHTAVSAHDIGIPLQSPIFGFGTPVSPNVWGEMSRSKAEASSDKEKRNKQILKDWLKVKTKGFIKPLALGRMGGRRVRV